MKKIKSSFEQLTVISHLTRWTILVIPVSLVAGSLVALFLWLLDEVTELRYANSWLLFLLPLAGVLIYCLYKYLGKDSEAGNNLIMNEIHEPGGGVPARMAPLVLFTTIITHLLVVLQDARELPFRSGAVWQICYPVGLNCRKKIRRLF